MDRLTLSVLFLFLLFFSGLGHASVSLGIDELEKSNFAILKGKRVGLITNPSGADSSGRSAIRVLYNGQSEGDFKLVKLFGPEHGIDGQAKAGRTVYNSRDRSTGLPVYSLYGDTRHPTPDMLVGIDTLVYDVQDLGNRSYTFISTLGYVMQAAADHNLEVIVLDRPNPLGGLRIEGPRLSSGTSSFVGLYDIPVVYGLTPAELARWINDHYVTKKCNLQWVAMKGWTRNMVWEDTGLSWIPTSPNIPTIGAARGYTATGFLGEIGLENGIGGPHPFEVLCGKDWDPSSVCQQFNRYHVPGVEAIPYEYTSQEPGDHGARYSGALLNMDPRYSGNLTAINFYAIDIYRQVVPHFSPFGHTNSDQRSMFDKVTGMPSIRGAVGSGYKADSIINSWKSGVNRWRSERKPYLIPSYDVGSTALTTSSSGTITTTTAPASNPSGYQGH